MRGPPHAHPAGPRAQREDDDEHNESKDIGVLTAQHPARQIADIARADGLDQPQQQAADHRPGQIADTTEHGRREGLETRQKAHGVMGRAVIEAYMMPAMAASTAPMMKVAEITMSGLTPMSAATRGFSAVAHGAPQLGVVNQIHQSRQSHCGDHQHQNLRGCDDRRADLIGRGRQQRGIGLVVGLPDDHGQRLQQDGDTDGRDQRRQSRAVAQRPVRDFSITRFSEAATTQAMMAAIKSMSQPGR